MNTPPNQVRFPVSRARVREGARVRTRRLAAFV